MAEWGGLAPGRLIPHHTRTFAGGDRHMAPGYPRLHRFSAGCSRSLPAINSFSAFNAIPSGSDRDARQPIHRGHRAMPQHRFGSEDATTIAPSAAARGSILVVDPDEDTRSLHGEWFRTSGCDVVEAADGREALAEALARPPALVITETRLPFIDGHALCEILRVDGLTSGVPILVVTSDARAAELTRVRTAGATAVLIKPVTPEQMLAETRRLLIDGSASHERVTVTESETAAAPPRSRGRRLLEVVRSRFHRAAATRAAGGALSALRSTPHLQAQSHRRRERTASRAMGLACVPVVRHVRVSASDQAPSSRERGRRPPLNGIERDAVESGSGSDRSFTIDANLTPS